MKKKLNGFLVNGSVFCALTKLYFSPVKIAAYLWALEIMFTFSVDGLQSEEWVKTERVLIKIIMAYDNNNYWQQCKMR